MMSPILSVVARHMRSRAPARQRLRTLAAMDAVAALAVLALVRIGHFVRLSGNIVTKAGLGQVHRNWEGGPEAPMLFWLAAATPGVIGSAYAVVHLAAAATQLRRARRTGATARTR